MGENILRLPYTGSQPLRVLLIEPPHRPTVTGVRPIVRDDVQPEPLALEMLAGSIPRENVRILDMRLENRWRPWVKTFDPHVVGISCYTTGVYIVRRILREIKKERPDRVTVVGGPHPSVVPQDFDRPYIDHVVKGLGTEPFQRLIDSVKETGAARGIPSVGYRDRGRLVFDGTWPLPSNLDTMARADRSLTDRWRGRYHMLGKRPLYSMVTQIGCTHRCNFCALWKLSQGRYIVRSPESIVEELEEIPGRYVLFADPHTFGDVSRARRLAALIRERGVDKRFLMLSRTDIIAKHPDLIEAWARVGLEYVVVGFESYTDDELASLNKNSTVQVNEEAAQILLDNGVTPFATFMVDPEYTPRQFRNLARYVRRHSFAYPFFSVLTPLPGTDLYESRRAELVTDNYELFNFVHSVLPTRLPRNAFYRHFIWLYIRSFSPARLLAVAARLLVAWLRRKRPRPTDRLPKLSLVRSQVKLHHLLPALLRAGRLRYDETAIDL